MTPTWKTFCRLLAAFRADRAGNIATIFALSSLPLIGFVGAAVDYSRANSVKTALQTALDATALMLSREAATLNSGDLQSKASNYFNAMFTRPDTANVAISVSYTTNGGSAVTVNGAVTMSTQIMGIVGYNSIAINGSSTARWGSTRLRVALALDVTGSMASDGKMTALKSATKNLLTQLKNAASQNGDVYVAIVPFNKDVNVGASNYAASWIDWSDWEDDNGHDVSTTTCTTQKTGKSGKSTKKCSTSTSWVPDNHNTWNGCITDRDQNYDQLVDVPTSTSAATPSKLWPAEQFDSCPAKMMGLSYNWTSLNSLVDGLQAVGNTNQGIGLVWAWQALVGGGPLTSPPKDANYDYQEIIILMSDGMNTENRYSTSQTQIDKRMHDTSKNGIGTCANIKTAGVTIYSVQVNTGGDPTSTVMKNCASSTDKFWMITSASDLNGVFQTIGTNLTQLRVAK